MEEEKDYEVYPESFSIKQVMDKRANPKTGQIEYLVQWEQWPEDYTWEPAKNIKGHFKKYDTFSNDRVLKYKRKINKLSGNTLKWKGDKVQQRVEDTQINKIKEENNQKQEEIEVDRGLAENETETENEDLLIQDLLNKYQLTLSISEIQNVHITEDDEENDDCTEDSEKRYLQLVDESEQNNDLISTSGYKILEKREFQNQIFYLTLFYDKNQSTWVTKQDLEYYSKQLQEQKLKVANEELNMSTLENSEYQNRSSKDKRENTIVQVELNDQDSCIIQSSDNANKVELNTEYTQTELFLQLQSKRDNSFNTQQKNETKRTHLQDENSSLSRNISENHENTQRRSSKQKMQIIKKGQNPSEEHHCIVGSLMQHKIDTIEEVVTFKYTINWKQTDDGKSPLPQMIQLQKINQKISPQEFIDSILQNDLFKPNSNSDSDGSLQS